MPPVRLLPPDIVNKIAAGEVIVRPASVVKELVENSLDAGARRVVIDITNGARDITVVDDGHGMERGDAEAALQRHATSKIVRFEDLEDLHTAGFRGEAVPSIASVSRLRIVTKRAGDLAATELQLEGGRLLAVASAAAPDGTRMEMRDLFFNVPARRKFLGSSVAELNRILDIVTRLAFAHVAVGFQLIADGRPRIELRPHGSLKERATQLLGGRFREALLEVDRATALAPREDDPDGGARHREVRLRGLIALPSHAAKTRTRQYFYANGRPIVHRRLPAVLQEAFRGVLMVRRFPVAVLFIEVPPRLLDVNVHPTKEEVRFADENLVCGLLFKAVQETLEGANLLPQLRLGDPAGGSDSASARPDYILSDAQLHQMRSTWTEPSRQSDLLLPSGAARSSGPSRSAAAAPSPAPPPAPRSFQDDLPDNEDFAQLGRRQESGQTTRARDAEVPFFSGPPPRALGQIGRTYIFAEVGNEALLIDQHAAHERLLYHRFAALPVQAAAQTLLMPVTFDAPADAMGFIDDLLDPLGELGIQIGAFGGATFLVQTVPADLPNLDVGALLTDLLSDFEEDSRLREVGEIRDRLRTRFACRAAIKAGQVLSIDEMNRLLVDMRAARLPFTCPHGRPTMLLLTRDQLDRQFGRMG